MKEALIVGAGGFAGSIARYLLQNIIVSRFVTVFPLGTFVINLAGSLLIGLLFGLAERYAGFTQPWRLLLAVGFCGGFTTFSTFAFDNLQLLRDGNFVQLFAYALLSLVLGVVLAALGYFITRP